MVQSHKKGFTLVELSIVLVIVGIIISVLATVLPSLLQSAKVRQARALQTRIDYSLEGFIAANGRIPCPDTNGDGLEDFSDNGTAGDTSDDTCGAYVGDLPYKTLGLPSGEDVWRNDIRYGAYDDFVKTNKTNFCANLSTFSTAAFSSAKIHTSVDSTNTNVAYVTVIGGPKDLDNADGFFDGQNTGGLGSLDFDIPNKIATTDYDDLVSAASFTYLNGKLCAGGSGGGGTGTSVVSGENSITDGCVNGVDDDGDGYIDCNDQDCSGVDPCGTSGALTITTAALPDGNVNQSDYTATIQASGGLSPYEWTLVSKGSPALDLYLHPYTGALTGNLDQCYQDGGYEIELKVVDSTPAGDGGPLEASKTLTLNVANGLTITGTATIEWSDALMSIPYTVSDGHLGSVTCSVEGDAGFYADWDSGLSTCMLRKDYDTGEGFYNVQVKAEDTTCADNVAQTNVIPIQVTADGAGLGIPEEDFVSQWHLDECTWGVVEDAMGKIPDGQAFNGATTTAFGKVCRAGYFDGQDDYVDMGDGDFFNDFFGPGVAEWSISLWIKPRSFNTSQSNHGTQNCFLAKASDANNDNLEFGVTPSGQVHVYIDTETATNGNANFGIAGDVQAHQWSHVVITYERTTNNIVEVTINGNKYANTTTWGAGQMRSSADSTVTLGATLHENQYFHGHIDEIMMFNKKLSDAEINALRSQTSTVCTGADLCMPGAEYRLDETAYTPNPDVVDSSGADNNAEAVNLPDGTQVGKVCTGGGFDDANHPNSDRIKVPNHVVHGLEDFTVTAHMKTAGGHSQTIISGNTASQDNQFLIYIPNGTTIQAFLFGASTSFNPGAGVNLFDNAWHHIAWVREADQQRMYVDGILRGSGSVSRNPVLIDQNGLWLASEQDSLAGGWAQSQELTGVLDEVYILDRALSAAEIAALAAPGARTCP